jgi:hypothetical protein
MNNGKTKKALVQQPNIFFNPGDKEVFLLLRNL